MKLRNFLAMMLVATCAVACSDDDDDVVVDETEVETSLGVDIAGTYTGYTSTTFAYISYAMTYNNETVVIEDAGDSKVNVTLTSSTWGTYAITDLDVTQSGTTYTIAQGTGTTTMSNHSDATSSYEFTMSGSVDSGIATFIISLSIMGGTTITFQTGEASAAALISGSYSGNMSLAVSTIDCGTVSTSVLLVADEDDNATLTLGGFSLDISAMGMSIALGDIAIPSVAVTANSDGSYTLTSESFEVGDVTYGDSSTITVLGSLSGTLDADGVLTINFSLTPGSMPFAITAIFSTSEEVVPAESVSAATDGVDGSYEGSMNMTVAGTDCGTVDETISLVTEEDGSVTLTMSAFSIMTYNLGAIAITDVQLTDNGDGTYSLANSEFSVADVTSGDSTITVSGSLEGTLDADGKLNLTMSLTMGSMPMPISVTFTME